MLNRQQYFSYSRTDENKSNSRQSGGREAWAAHLSFAMFAAFCDSIVDIM